MADLSPELLAENFVFLEGPRWHDGALWFSDMWDYKVHKLLPDGTTSEVVGIPQRPSGLGFLPNNDMLIVSMADRIVYKFSNNSLTPYADLSGTVGGDVNDMLIDDAGRTYVGNFGYDIFNEAPERNAEIVLIEPDGSHRVVADDLMFPNGMVLLNGGKTLVVAETFGHRLTAYDRDTNGDLSNRRVFADMGEMTPDGICADVAGGVWVASFMTGDFVRIEDGGNITNQFNVGCAAVACQIGGPQNDTLYCLTYSGEIADLSTGARLARILTVKAPHAGAGSP